ncbi:MAG: hypothetical protein ACYS76_04565 [Planctomycetota bacterium]
MTKKNISGLISVFLLAVVGLALTPTIQEMVTGVTGTGGNNLTGAGQDIMALFPLFWVILMIAIPVAYVAVWLKGA